MYTHEQYIHDVAALAITRVPKKADARRLKAIKLVYGSGGYGLRGVTFYEAWKGGISSRRGAPLVEICAFGESSRLQIAGTTIHELGHVLAGLGTGHGKGWKDACQVLGLHISSAGGQEYKKSDFDPGLWKTLQALKKPTDGAPATKAALRPGGAAVRLTPKPCSMGVGVRGGKSRGIGSGSRLIKVSCAECGYTCRVTRKWLNIGPPRCPEHGAMKETET